MSAFIGGIEVLVCVSVDVFDCEHTRVFISVGYTCVFCECVYICEFICECP